MGTIFDYFYDYSCTWLVLTGFWFYTKPIVCLFIAESIFHLRGTNPIVKAFLTTVSQCALTSFWGMTMKSFFTRSIFSHPFIYLGSILSGLCANNGSQCISF